MCTLFYISLYSPVVHVVSLAGCQHVISVRLHQGLKGEKPITSIVSLVLPKKSFLILLTRSSGPGPTRPGIRSSSREALRTCLKPAGGKQLTLHIIICANPRCFRCTPYSFPVVDKDEIPVVSVEEDVEVGPVPSEALERHGKYLLLFLCCFFHDFHACYMPWRRKTSWRRPWVCSRFSSQWPSWAENWQKNWRKIVKHWVMPQIRGKKIKSSHVFLQLQYEGGDRFVARKKVQVVVPGENSPVPTRDLWEKKFFC